MEMAMQLMPALDDWSGESPLHPYFVCDVFTSNPLEGNQLGVFVDGRPFGAGEMRRIARELKFTETVFLLPPQDGGDVRMRIFTPGGELPFAGHPVLGTAFVAGSALGRDEVVLETGAGPVPVALERDGGRIVSGSMRQPIPVWEPFPDQDELLAALGVHASTLPVEHYAIGPQPVFVGLESEAALAALRPRMDRLEALPFAVSCFAGSGARWKARVFAPAAGVPEDPATGSAAGPLAVHLARHGRIAFGERIAIRQGEEIGRPSLLHAAVHGTAERIESVEVGGAAVIVAQGRYRIA
jgi:trans-2,3-dihydro-3-hydroxyanthranilate isomerase